MNGKSVSIVVCTYNGEKYLKEQLDSLLSQTYPIDEIIIQDDHSTDDTMAILNDYANRHQSIKLFTNEAQRGLNGNFFSAMRRATGDFIAISDQDDIWESTKVEKQIERIGDNLLCVCRSLPFSSDGSYVNHDPRTPNYFLIRLLYCSISGHTMLFNRRLLDLLPEQNEDYKANYDVYLELTAACHGGLVLLDEFLVHWRRYHGASTFTEFDKRRTRSTSNALYMLQWSVMNFSKVRPPMRAFFERRLRLLEAISATGKVFDDMKRMAELQTRKGLWYLFPLTRLHVKYRHNLFYAEEKGVVNFVRAVLYGIMQVYNYRHMLIDEPRPYDK